MADSKTLPSPLPGRPPLARRLIRHARLWPVLLLALIVGVPLAVLGSSVFARTGEIWAHLVQYVLPDLLINTFWLLAGVLLGTFTLGVSLAWLVARHEFPGRRFFSWALLLPLAVPAYVMAFVLIGLLDFTGPVQTWLRTAYGITDLPSIRSRGGVILAMVLTLYPYVYLLARGAFATQGQRAMEAARSLGLSPWQAFWRAALPMSWPWIAGGLLLVAMETLADFGTVATFNYDTFTNAIYKAWYGMFSIDAASQLSCILIAFVILLVSWEAQARTHRRFFQAGRSPAAARTRLAGGRGLAATAAATLIFTAAFAIPVGQLLIWAHTALQEGLDSRYLEFTRNSLLLGLSAALIIVLASLQLAYARRRHPSRLGRFSIRMATLGYALPGTVLAVGIVIPVAWLDNAWIHLAGTLGIPNAGPILQGSVLILIVGYLVRFLAVAFQPVSSNLERITPSMEEAARSMGVSGARMLWRVHLPLLRPGLLSAAVLVFVDVMKEMPITLMLRSFGWDTLAIRIFEMTSEGMWEQAALPAIVLIAVGVVPIMILSAQAEKQALSSEDSRGND